MVGDGETDGNGEISWRRSILDGRGCLWSKGWK